MGDSGSMLIGLVLSASALTLTGQFNGTDIDARTATASSSTVLPVLLPVSLLMVPVADLVLAVVRRTRAGRSPFAPDKQHLHHRLLEIGHSQRRAVLIMWMWAALVWLRGGAGQPLRAVRGCGGASATMVVSLIAMTFVLSSLHRSRKTGPGHPGLPQNARFESRTGTL